MTSAINLAAIPSELRERKQWVLWRREERNGKTTKVPYRSDGGGRASSTDPATWNSFAASVDAHETLRADGIGFVFTADDPYVGVDLDAGLDELERAEILSTLDSYAEESVSGSGVHIIVRASLNGHRRNRKGPFEVYEAGRFFVVTGAHLAGTPTTIETRQAELDTMVERFVPAPTPVEPRERQSVAPVDLDDPELLERAFAAKNGPAFRRLWDGQWDYPSQSEADLALCSMLAFWTHGDHDRIDRLFRSSGLFRAKWNERRGESTYGAQTIEKALAGQTDIYRRVPGRPDRRLDDIGNAARFVDQHGDALHYVPAWGRWLVYDGRRWAEDERLEPLRRAKATARALIAEAGREEDDKPRGRLLKHAEQSAAEPKLRAMLTVASEELALRPRDLDVDPYALNTESGTVDLRTGLLRPHRPEDLLTLLAGAPYNPDASCPMWDAHLRRCLVADELIEFLRQLAGAAAVGTSREQRLAILYGTGANGKSATRNAIAGALGDYAHQSSLDLLMQSRRGVGQATPELADLRGRRFVTVSETPEDGKLSVERVKAITGGEPITARHLRHNPFTFDPSHSVWLSTNHLPRIADTTHAIWRRVLLIPFTVTIPEAEQDNDFGDKLAAESPGILRWIVEGAVSYLRDGLNPPGIVEAATRTYRESEDTFAAFIAERCIAEPDASEAAADLRRAHNEWAEQNGASTISPNALAQRLTTLGYERRRTKTGTRWHGLRLTHEGTFDV